MRQGFLRSSRYSPGNMDRESLEALFVGREDVMEDVVSRIADSIRQPQKHYILLIGPRGSGKTHFLSLAYHRILDRIRTAGLGDSTAIALLNEEEWGVASYLDLFVRILRSLAVQAPELFPKIEQISEKFSRDPADAEAFAASLIAEHTRGRTLLLLCENLVDLFHGLNDEGQKRWRAAIQQSGNWSIVATTPALFPGLQLQEHPFYGFFTIRHLKSIDADTGLELLVRKAIHENDLDLASFLKTPLGRARVRAIHHLAAGNHRAYVVLFDFLDKESLDDLVGPFMHMVDDLTPYFQDRMRQLPPTQRKIVEFLSLESTPTSIKEIASACLMSHQTASKQIGELAAARFVSRIRSGRNTYCELSEPLMRICIEVKDNRTRHFRLFVEFLRHWFSSRELERRLAAIQHDHDTPVLDRLHVEEAMADHHSASAAFREVIARDPSDVSAHCRLSDSLLSIGDYDEAVKVTGRLIELDPDHSHAYYARARALIELDRIPEAIADLDRLLPTEDFDALMFAASEARRIGHCDSATRYLDRAAELQPDDSELWRERTLLQIDAGDFHAAAESAAHVETLSPNSLNARLLVMQAMAATTPLDAVFERLDTGMHFDLAIAEEEEYVEAFSAILSVSVRAFGPRYLHRGILALRNLLADVPDKGILGNILTEFLFESLNAFKGSLEEWDDCLNGLADSLADASDTLIPFEMLNAAVRYTKTADKKHLLRLPLEQRQLLEDIHPQ